MQRLLAILVALVMSGTHMLAAAPAEPDPVSVSAESGKTYLRLAFRWPAPVGYSASIGGRRLVIRFDRPMKTTFRPVQRMLDPFVVSTELEPDRRTIGFRLRADYELRETALGETIFFDLYESGAAPEPPEAPAAPEQASTVPQTPPGAVQYGRFDPPLHKPNPPLLAMPDSGASDIETVAHAVSAGSAHGRAKGDPNAPVQLIPELAAPSFLRVMLDGDETILRFDWNESVAAAAFRRGPYLWLVFDRNARPELEAAREALGDIVPEILEVEVDRGLVLRLTVPEWLNANINREGRSWMIALRRGSAQSSRAIEVERGHLPDGQSFIALPFEGTGDVMLFEDPEVGDIVTVVPVIPARLGIARDRRFAQFAMPATVQGVVVLEYGDGIVVERQRWGVQIRSRQDLVFTPIVEESGTHESGSLDARLLDFATWLRSDAGSFTDEEQAILSRLVAAPEEELSEHRLDLARFYFARGLAAEARGVLARLADEDTEIAERPANRVLAGAVSYLTGDIAGARQDILSHDFGGNADAALWQGMVRLAEGESERAAVDFARGVAALPDYPIHYRMRIAFAAARNALDAGDAAQAVVFLSAVEEVELAPADREVFDALQGRVLLAGLETDQAIAVWDAVIAEGTGPGRQEAQFARVEAQLANGAITAEEAITELDRLRFAWRGGDLEFKILDLLGRLQIDTGRIDLGLVRLRTAVTSFPNHPRAGDATARMAEAFAQHFLTMAGTDEPPLRDLALFNEYRELTPAGELGERLVSALIERLVAADLLTQATDLLNHQVRYRLKGAEKARAGAELAVLLLRENEPQAAAEALRASAATGIPSSLVAERQRLEAQALFELGDAARALDLLIGDPSEEALVLTAAIQWRVGNWAAAAEAYEALLSGLQTDRPIRNEEAEFALRLAISLIRTGAMDAASALGPRFAKAMDGSPFAAAFAAVTTPGQTGPADGDYRSRLNALADSSAFRDLLVPMVVN